jgi:hypothetical protein
MMQNMAIPMENGGGRDPSKCLGRELCGHFGQ